MLSSPRFNQACTKGMLAAAFAAWFLSPLASAADTPEPAPMPPPPELLTDIEGFNLPYIEPQAASESPEATREALQPLPNVSNSPESAAAPTPSAQPSYPSQAAYLDSYRHYLAPDNAVPQPSQPIAAAPLPIAAAETTPSPIVISPPSASMPAEYFDLPLVQDGIPGVLLPEIDYAYTEPGMPQPSARRPRMQGMTIRQLEPLFALAKGSEGEALDAKQRNDDFMYADQLKKAVDAYMEIVENADAGHEAREEAWYGVARCEYRLGNWWRAFEALERSFPEEYRQPEILGRIKLEMYIGERLWRMGNEPVADAVAGGEQLTGYQAASRVYGAAIFNQPTSEDAPLALLRRGDASALEKDWKEAAKYYRQVVEYFPESEQAMQARSSLAEAILNDEKQYGVREDAWKDMGKIMDDVERARNNLSDEAAERHQRAVRVANDEIAETKLRHAKEYLKSLRMRKSRDAAVWLLGDIVSNYPETGQAEEARQLLLGMGIEPPMRLSDGDRFPVTSGWSGRDAQQSGANGGSVRLEGQDDNGRGALPPSPTRETILDSFDVPGTGEEPPVPAR